ncbi:MAG: DUF2232 domain-containing protein [Clostridia bacterium]|nr:DUF2232 domain-containing protein [Clostridia bacterium]
MQNHSPGKVIAASALGVMAGLLQIIGLPLSMVCVGGTVIAPLLFAWAGLLPAAVFLCVSVGSLAALLGVGAAAIGALIFGAPAVVVIALMRARAPFFTRMKAAAGAQLGAMLALILILYAALGRSLVDVAMDMFAAWADGLSPQMAQFLLQQFALTGMGTLMTVETAQQILTEGLSQAETLAMLHGIFDTTGQALRLGLPAMLLSSGLLTGMLATALPGYVCARRGGDLDYAPLFKWRLPPRVTVGALVCLVTAGALYAAKADGAESVLNAVLNGGVTVYAAAGAAAISRRFRETGRSRGFRIALIAAGLWIAPRLVALIGVASALLGREGLITGYMKKKMKDQNKEDDD